MGVSLLKFRCTGCGNCCKDPLLPLTDFDLRRLVARTGERASRLVAWVDRNGIDMDDEPEAFVELRVGKRVMVLRHEGGGCRFLGADDRCTVYSSRPLGCRVFPFDASFSRAGGLRRLKLIQATECRYELDGENDVQRLQELDTHYRAAGRAYHAKVAEWNRIQRARSRRGKLVEGAREYLEFLGFSEPSGRAAPVQRRSRPTALG